MASLRRLQRRLARWHRFDALTIGRHAPWYWQGQSSGYWRVWTDVQLERKRRGLAHSLHDLGEGDDDFHRPGYEEDGTVYPELMPTEYGWLE